MQGNDRLPLTIGGYRVVKRLAREATVDVLLARREGQGGDERTVTLNVLSPAFRGDTTFDTLFSRETQALSQLDHPCVVRLVDVFSNADTKVMVFEHVVGTNLAELRLSMGARAEVLPDVAVYAIAASVFAALAAAHAARDPQSGNLLPIVHRDVHPGHIVVGKSGAVKLGGFGLERITGVRGDAKGGGSRAYLPPEKARGEVVTIRSDVYAAMLVVWELFARRRAVRDDALPEQELARALAHPTLVSLEVLRPDLPPLVRSIVARGLEPQVERRMVTAEEAASVFRSAVPMAEAEEALALLVAGAPQAPPRREPSLPVIAPSPTAGEVAVDRKQPPRPAPRRMWNSSPTLTPSGGFTPPPSSRPGSIPDARFSQEPERHGPRPAPLPAESEPSASPAPAHVEPMPSHFDVTSLKPLLVTPPPGAVVSPPAALPEVTPAKAAVQQLLPTPAAPFTPAGATADDPFRAPQGSLPGMGVPLAPLEAVLSPAPPAVEATPNESSPLWSKPIPPSAVPTYRPPRPQPKQTNAALAVGVFLVATAIGAAGFVMLFRRTPRVTVPVPVATSAPSVAVAAARGPEPTKPEATKPEATKPEATKPEATKPEATKPEATKPEATKPEPTKPEATKPEATKPEATKPEGTAAPDASKASLRVITKVAGHRVFVDGRVVGEGEGPFLVPCGKRAVKVGSRGKVQNVDLPCGGELSVTK